MQGRRTRLAPTHPHARPGSPGTKHLACPRARSGLAGFGRVSCPIARQEPERGYRHEQDKFGVAGLTALPAETVLAPRVAECPVQLEAVLEDEHAYDAEGPMSGFIAILEARITRAHVDRAILMDGHPNRIDPDKWRPLIMSFQEYYGLGPKLHPSRLGEIPEERYRTPDFERAVEG